MLTFGNKDANTYIIQPVNEAEEGFLDNEIKLIKSLSKKNFYLLALPVSNWNNDLSPWEAPPVFGNEPFGSGAIDYLSFIESEIISKNKDKTHIIAGYSLAGLFGLWASCNTNAFLGVIAASPSAWFPGFTDYLKDHKPSVKSVYLSLGNKEAKTKNSVMKTVDEKIQDIHNIIMEHGINCTFEWNKGNHFKDGDLRLAKGISWVLNII